MLSFNWKSRKSRDSEAELRHFMQAARDSTEAQIDKWIEYYVRYGSMKDPAPEIVKHLRAYFNDIRNETGKPHEAGRQLLRLQRIALRFGMMDWYALRGKGRDLGILIEDASHSTNFVTATLTTAGGSEGDSEKLLRGSDLESYLIVHEKIAELFPKASDALLFLRDIKTNEDFETKVDTYCEDDTKSASLRTAWKVVALAKPDWWDADGSKVNVGPGSSLVMPYPLHKMRLCFTSEESRPPEARIGDDLREHLLSKLWSSISCVTYSPYLITNLESIDAVVVASSDNALVIEGSATDRVQAVFKQQEHEHFTAYWERFCQLIKVKESQIFDVIDQGFEAINTFNKKWILGPNADRRFYKHEWANEPWVQPMRTFEEHWLEAEGLALAPAVRIGAEIDPKDWNQVKVEWSTFTPARDRMQLSDKDPVPECQYIGCHSRTAGSVAAASKIVKSLGSDLISYGSTGLAHSWTEDSLRSLTDFVTVSNTYVNISALPYSEQEKGKFSICLEELASALTEEAAKVEVRTAIASSSRSQQGVSPVDVYD